MTRAKSLTLAEASALANLTPRRLRRLCAAGRVRGARKIGATWLLPPSFRIDEVRHGRPLENVPEERIRRTKSQEGEGRG